MQGDTGTSGRSFRIADFRLRCFASSGLCCSHRLAVIPAGNPIVPLYNEQVSILRHVSSRLAPLAHPVTNFRALRQDLRRQRVKGRALIDPHNTYRPSVRAELRRMFTRPLPVETQTLICNALLAAICWYLLPEAWRSWLFSEFKGPAGFALVMVGWMVADVTSTNLMGHDEEHALRALRSSDPHALRLFVRTKAIAIGLITGISGTLLALILHSQDKHLTPTLMMSLSFFVVPAIVVSLGSILGVVYPYRLRGWQFRWAHRKNLRMSVRWVLLCFGPGWVLGTVLMSLMFPSIFLSDAIIRIFDPGTHPRDNAFRPLLFSLILWAQGAISLWVFPRITARIATARRAWLVHYLTDDKVC